MWQFTARVRSFLCVMLILLAAPVGLAQVQPYDLSISMMYGVMYPADQWVPLRLTVSNNTDQDFTGHVSLPVREVGGGAEFQVPVRVPARSSVQYVAYAYFPAEVPRTQEEQRRGLVPPVTTAELRDHLGARRDQEPLVAQVLGDGDFATGQSVLTLVITGDTFNEADAFDPSGFITQVKAARQHNTAPHVQPARELPRHPAGMGSIRIAVLSQCDPELLDPAQRDVLLQFVRGGGVLVVAAPEVSAVRGSWLAEHLPVRLVGERLTDRIRGQDGVELPTIDWVPMTEALAGGSEDVVVLRDAHFVHAAYREMGLGRIVFTSFPLSGLQEDDRNAVALWQRLLNPPYVPQDWDRTYLTAETESGSTHRDMILSRMIGRQVPAWSLAAGIAGIYVLTVLGTQVVLRGVWRPRAFGVTVVVALLLTGGLMGAAMLRQQEQKPMAARIAVVDMGQDGGGIIREVAAFVGAESNTFALKAAGPNVWLRPMASFTPNDLPEVSQYPFAAPRAGIRTESYQRVWQAQGSTTGQRIAAVGQFDDQGLVLRVDNAMGAPLHSPRLQWGTRQMPLSGTLATGESQARAQRSTASGMLVSGEDSLRDEVLNALRPMGMWLPGAEARDASLLLVGFVDDAALDVLIEPAEQTEVETRSQTLVRVPVRIEPSPAGQRVRIPAPLMEMVLGSAHGVPYDASRGEWLPSSAAGRLLIGFRPPEGIGQLRPVQLMLDANISAPQHRVTLRRSQVRDGKVAVNPSGEVIGQWDKPVGPQDVTVQLEARDADAQGVIWLMFDVERAGPPVPGELPSMWQFQWLRAAYDAQVAG